MPSRGPDEGLKNGWGRGLGEGNEWTGSCRGTSQGELFDIGAKSEGVMRIRADHPVFRQREAQVQTMPGRRLPSAAWYFTELLVFPLERRD
jgi:hypothetical protein